MPGRSSHSDAPPTAFPLPSRAGILAWAALCCIAAAPLARAQTPPAAGYLDPSRAIAHPRPVGSFHQPLPEQYIWTANDAAVLSSNASALIRRTDSKIDRHYFRASFDLAAPPKRATLYLAGPRSARVFLNGRLAADLRWEGGHHMVFHTLSADVHGLLLPGKNVIAIEAVRGWGNHHHTNSLRTAQVNSGEVLVVKIVPSAPGVNAAPLMTSSSAWTSTLHPQDGWQQTSFDASAWQPVQSLGSIEGDIDFFQWNADAGLYDWPGYLGEAPYLANYQMAALHAIALDDPSAALSHLAALVRSSPRADAHRRFTASTQPPPASGLPAPGILLDFGQEASGRVLFESASERPAHVTLQYGESLGELQHAPYLGVNPLLVPPRGLARGPKSGFRYALIRFLPGSGPVAFSKISLEGIYHPVHYLGSFASSDERLNRIWETSAYTAHLCMQDSIWDGVKRDRGRWMGDMEVIDRVVADVFGDLHLANDAMAQLIGPAPVKDHVDGLPGYSAFWIVGEAEYVRRSGDIAQLRSMHARLLQLLSVMDREMDSSNLYAAASGKKPFVDWSQGFASDTPQARAAMQFEYLYAFRQAASLLHMLGDHPAASYWSARADQLSAAAQQHLLSPSTNTFGDRWQTNAMAILSGAANDQQQSAIWRSVLARANGPHQPQDVITPYYGDYMLMAMARSGHRREALDWMRSYWGGMLDEGATSFWEAYDPSWPKTDPHAFLQADGKIGYNASLAHGWSSGPAAWLMEEILGIQPSAPGFSKARIRPDLAGLQWAKGAVPTPHGLIHVDARPSGATIDLPAGVDAEVLLPSAGASQHVLANGTEIASTSVEDGSRLRVDLPRAGHYVLRVH